MKPSIPFGKLIITISSKIFLEPSQQDKSLRSPPPCPSPLAMSQVHRKKADSQKPSICLTPTSPHLTLYQELLLSRTQPDHKKEPKGRPAFCLRNHTQRHLRTN